MGLPVGTILGKYELVQQLGAGGESIVYKGRDTLLDRFVAIKQVSPQMAADEKFSTRFREVARQLAKLNCEQVVTIYELFEQEGGLFVVMEFVEGHTIETTLASQPGAIEPKAVLQIIWRIAAGLAVLHRSGIVHRDIKPGNIIVGEGLRVKITDFGMAARIGVPASMRLGTTKYMAPELFAGETPDARADIYSLGMIAYEMLLGRQKFDEVFHDVVRDPHSEALRWMKWHSSRDQTAPALHETNPNVPPELSAIVARMTAKDPADRYPSVELLGRDIKGSFSPRAAGAPPARKSGKRRKLSGAAAAEAEKIGPAVGAPVVGDEGDELTVAPVAPSGPLTTEVPKQGMTLVRKLVLVGVAFAVILGVLAGYMVWYMGWKAPKERGVLKQAALAFDTATALYKDGGKADQSSQKKKAYEDALEAFRGVIATYPTTRFGRKAEAMGYLCRLYLDVLAKDWKKMDEDQAVVQQWMLNAQRAGDKDLYEFSHTVEQEINDFRDYWSHSKAYADLMKQAKEAEDRGEFDAVEQLLQRAKEYARVQAEWLVEINDASQRIKEKRKQTEFWALFKQAEDLLKKKGADQARAMFLKAIEVLDRDKESLPEKMYAELKQTAQARVDTLDRDQRYDSAKSEGDKALAAGMRLVAALAYERALTIKPEDPDKLKDKIVQLKHDNYLDEGRKQMQAGNLPEAEKAFLEAKKVKDSPAVEAALNKIRDQGSYQGLLGEGKKLFSQGSYESALAKYDQASKMGVPAPDKELPNQIMECRYRIQMGLANAYRGKKEWDKAIEALNQARQIKPADSAAVDAVLEIVKQDRSYEKKMDEAKGALKNRNYGEALTRAQEAQKYKATIDVKALVDEIRYQQQMESGDNAMATGDFAGAIGYYELAKRYKSTPEVDAKIAKCKDAIKSKGG